MKKISFTYFSLPMLLTAILNALLGLNINMKGISGGGATGKVNEGKLMDECAWLVNIDEALLQWV